MIGGLALYRFFFQIHPGSIKGPRSSSSSGTSNDLFRETHRHLGRRPIHRSRLVQGLRGQH